MSKSSVNFCALPILASAPVISVALATALPALARPAFIIMFNHQSSHLVLLQIKFILTSKFQITFLFSNWEPKPLLNTQ